MITKNLSLKSLSLTNFATFENQIIHFSEGFNVIIGETGSGKSLIFDALQLVFSNKSDKKIIRAQAEFSSIEAIFEWHDPSIKVFFDDLGYPLNNDDDIIIKKIIYSNGKSKSFINHQQASSQNIGLFAKNFIDFVGQFENQKLLSPSYLLSILDKFSHNTDLLNAYKTDYRKYKNLLSEKEKLLINQDQKEQRIDYLKFQINEIEELNPQEEEEQQLIKKKNNIVHFEKKSALLIKLAELMSYDSDHSILSQAALVKSIFLKDKNLFDNLNINKLEQCIDLFEDFWKEVSSQSQEELSDEEVANVIHRIDLYQKIKRKYGTEISEIKMKLLELSKELNDLQSSQEIENQYDIEINKLVIKLKSLATELSNRRHEAAEQLAKKLTTSIRSLNMKGATIKIDVTNENEFSETGLNQLIFNAQTNPGEGFFKLQAIASGGELSRIILSLRQIITSNESISIFLFDEVDAGMGGETALLIGKSLEVVSQGSQVITITHLPQIAIHATQIIKVEKIIDRNKRTQSQINIINGPMIKNEIKKMIPIELN